MENLDQEYLEALKKRAFGYEYEERIIEVGRDGKAGKARVIKKHVPPDTTALKELKKYMDEGW